MKSLIALAVAVAFSTSALAQAPKAAEPAKAAAPAAAPAKADVMKKGHKKPTKMGEHKRPKTKMKKADDKK